MTSSFMRSSAKHFVVIRAVREIRQEIEKAGLDNLEILANKGVSIVGTYLNACSPQEKARYKRDINALLGMGVTADMVLTELARQLPVVAPIMEAKPDYRKTEIARLTEFAKSG